MKKFTRLLTLVCFFYFSGLNNGFTAFVVSSGKFEPVDFASVAVRGLAGVLNPAHWKRRVIEPMRYALLSGSTRLIGSASQRAVQQILIESTFLQLSVRDYCAKAADFGGSILEETAAMVRAEKPAPRTDLAAGRPAERDCRMDQAPGYLKTDKRVSWLRHRYPLWEGGKWTLACLSPASKGHDSKGSADPQPGPASAARRLVRFVPDRFQARLSFSGEDSDGPSSNFKSPNGESNPAITKRRGFLTPKVRGKNHDRTHRQHA